jgi:uncharacterized damage-inducible protein DinB
VERNLLDYVASLTSEDIQRLVEFKSFAGAPMAEPLWQCLQHAANHGTYHRGQVATLLRQHGAQPIQTDLMHFYRERGAAAGA